MPITGFTWAQFKGGDIHVLRNDEPSVRLDETLIVVEELTNLTDPEGNHKLLFKDLKTINSGVDAPPEFGQALFTPSWIERATVSGPSLLSFNGITLNEKTGEIRAVPPVSPPGRSITSFFMSIAVEPTAGHTLSLPAALIAVHVHNSITNAWVTPSSLTTRPDIVKGISNLELKIISTKPIEKITWGSDDTFQHPMSKFLLNDKDPFDGVTSFPLNAKFGFPPALLFDNRRLFPVNEVFVDPIRLEVKYAGQADPVRMTIPTHLSHLIQIGQTFDDGAGNNVFEVSVVEKKAQYKASVYATFDDEVIGDVTNQHGLTWERGPGVDVNDIKFDSDGAFEVAASAVGKTLPIRVQFPARLTGTGVTSATGNVIVRESWSNANPIAERLTGSPTQLAAADIPNVLFVAEGFTNRGEFQNAALSVYNRLRDEPKTTPWNHLFKSRMNAWMLFEESRESSASYLYESIAPRNVRLEDGNPRDIALPLGEIIDLGSRRPLDDGSGLNLGRLTALVGLPLPADAQATSGTKTSDWVQLVDSRFGTGNFTFSNDEFELWKRLSPRILVEERDTAWGLRCGEKPKQAPAVRSNIIALNHESRLQRSNLDFFLSRVRADSVAGDLIGERFWGRDRQGKFGKDYGLVVFLVGGSRSIGTRFGESHFPEKIVNTGIGVGIVDDRVILNFLNPQLSSTFPFFLWISSGPSFAMEPFPVPTDVSLAAFATIAHELSHSFNVEDEYSEIEASMPVPDQQRLLPVFNLQGRNELLNAGKLSGERIKWRWPRINKAGVLESAPTVGPQISVTLRAGDVAQFVVDEVVRFRHRDIIKTPHADLSSPELMVRGKNETDRTVLLEPLAATTVDWTAFGPNSLLYAPVKAPTESRNNPLGDVYAEVLSPLMRDHITKSVNGHQSITPCENEESREQNPVNLPANLSRPKERRRIVGLFSGGRRFSCDVYHASGECIMRKETGIFTPQGAAVNLARDRRTYRFCHVCQYSLVDQIDPKQHSEIDKQYDENYPLTEKPTSVLKVIVIIVGVLAVLALGYLIVKESD